MNRTKRIQNILEKNITKVNIEIIDNSYLHKGHNNFNGQGETHITIKLQINSELKRLERPKDYPVEGFLWKLALPFENNWPILPE